MKKHRKVIFWVFLVALSIYGYEKRSFRTTKDNISVTIWPGLFGTGVYYLYPYKCYNILQPGKEYIKVNTRNQFLELRFIDDKRLVICASNKDFIDIQLVNYKVEKIYSGYDERVDFDSLFPCEKCKACFNWAKIWEGPYISND